MKALLTGWFGAPTALTYSREGKLQTSLASVIEGLDIFGRLSLQEREGESAAGLRLETLQPAGGFALLAWLTGRLPLLWPLFPLLGLPFALIARSPGAPGAELTGLRKEDTARK